MSVQQNNKIIALAAVIAKTSLCRSSIYALLANGDFPARIKLSPRRMGFLESEIDTWIAERSANRG